MRLRQVALAAAELEPVVDRLCAALDIQVSFRDPGVAEFGLRNAVMPVGESFLEVVSPVREDASAARWLAKRGGDGGYMVIVQSDDLAADRRRLREHDVRIVWEVELPDAATLHLHPRDVGGAIVSLDAMSPPESWRWAGPDWRACVRRGSVQGLAGVVLEASRPEALAERWSRVLGRSWHGADGGAEVELDAGRIRFVPGEREGITAVELIAADPERARARARKGAPVDPSGDPVVGGVRLRFRPPA